ncbi:MAG: SCO1664 family protein [Micromonosporaceae bacterium]
MPRRPSPAGGEAPEAGPSPEAGPPPEVGPPPRLATEQALRLLTEGEIELEGRLVEASNTTLRAFISLDEITARCVYKPVRGERPLWDFPDGTLAGREVAAYLVSAGTGWDVVPPTVLREGPLGLGACQLWIDEPDDAVPLVGFVPVDTLPADWLRVANARGSDGRAYLLAHADDAALARLALFDVVVNNADRKGGHVLLDGAGHLYGVDHGVCFHTEDKLRTVLWGWVGRALPDDCRADLTALRDALERGLGEELAGLLSPDEVATTVARVQRLLDAGEFPEPGEGWPAVPWPPM